MKQDNHTKIQKNEYQTPMVDGMRQMLASTICAQNRSRKQFISNVQFGDPIWDITLNLYTAEYFRKTTTVSSLSEQSGIPISVVARCIKYLLNQDAVFENTNQYSNGSMPYLVSEASKVEIGAWLDNCMSNLQTGLNEVTSYSD